MRADRGEPAADYDHHQLDVDDHVDLDHDQHDGSPTTTTSSTTSTTEAPTTTTTTSSSTTTTTVGSPSGAFL